jgi:membrane-bound lytic murein transglycosylase B
VHIGGGAALEAARRHAGRLVPRVRAAFAMNVVRDALSVDGVRGAFTAPRMRVVSGIAVITPVILAGAVAGTAQPTNPVRDAAVTPLAAVETPSGTRSGVSVVAVTKTPTAFHIAATSSASPQPAAMVNSPGALRIPTMALSAYQNAERIMAAADPACGVSWNLLAGIGRIESMHAFGGATDQRGTAVSPIYGPALDGTLPGNEIIVQSRTADRVTYARAMGPMQFLPGTWSRYASDGDGDGKADVQNVYDASLATARYLCSGGLNLRDPSHVMASILRYNNSMAYARNVMGWAAAYATGVVPLDLPPITGPVPPIADMHLDNYEGLGPGLPMNALGLPANDPLALMPVLGGTDVASQLPGFVPGQRLGPLPGPVPGPLAAPVTQQEPAQLAPPWVQQPPKPQCAVFCIQDQPQPLQPALAGPPDAQPLQPAPMAPAPGPAEQVAGLPPAVGPAPAAPATEPAPAPPATEVPAAGSPPGPLPGPAG